MTPLLDGPLACVDLETTGGSANHHRVIEVGIVLLEGGEVVEEWNSLVNPGCRVPGQIEQFTGITNDMVADAPSFADLAATIMARLEGRLFLAHNARFDYGFLRNEFRRTGMRFRAPVLCTVRLSRRMDPGVRGHGLDAVMERHGLSCSARHRALGDARVLADLIALWRRERDASEVDAVVRDLVQAPRLPPQLDPALADDLPESPGVYLFYGEGDALLYVGKSVNLRSRVLSHFDGDHRSAKELRLSRQVRRVEWVETAGEVGALLKEARWVKERMPLHNRRLRAAGETWTIRLNCAGEGVQADLVPLAEAAAGGPEPECYGTFRSRRDASKALEQLVRAHQLCARALGLEDGQGSCFGYQVGRCRGACCGEEPPALHAARARMSLAQHKLRRWPFGGRIGIRERDWRGQEETHVFDRWRYLGTVCSADELERLPDSGETAFDLDCYRILSRLLERLPSRARLVELD
jgi:DNA polymerase-3 subunit epsilon